MSQCILLFLGPIQYRSLSLSLLIYHHNLRGRHKRGYSVLFLAFSRALVLQVGHTYSFVCLQLVPYHLGEFCSSSTPVMVVPLVP